jgi:hypothetical protein
MPQAGSCTYRIAFGSRAVQQLTWRTVGSFTSSLRYDTVRLSATANANTRQDGTGHRQGQRRAPCSCNFEEAEHFCRMCHSGKDQTEPED